MPSLTLQDLIDLERKRNPEVPEVGEILLCRHVARDRGLQVRLADDGDLLNAFQSEQNRDVFRDKSLVLAFVPDGGQRSLFLGAFRNRGAITVDAYLKRFPKNPVAQYPGYEDSGTDLPGRCYNALDASPILGSFRRRLVIDWGAGTRKWDQSKLDKPVLEIRSEDHGEGFVDYPDVQLRFPVLKAILDKPEQNGRWHERLKAVQAVYLILDEKTGQQYVGSATGQEGLLGRWREYARSGGHGDNKELINLLKRRPDAAGDLNFSILRVFDRHVPRERVLDAEARLKLHLGARTHGLCAN